MGSITSKPSAPPAQQPVVISYNYPAPVAPAPVTAVPAPPPAPATPAPANDSGASEQAKGEARAAGLLDRRRGVLGTVLTGFRGLLNQGVSNARKTLLGE